MGDGKKLLAAKTDLDREYKEQEILLDRYGRNRAGRRRVIAEMKRRKRPDRPKKPRKKRRRR